MDHKMPLKHTHTEEKAAPPASIRATEPNIRESPPTTPQATTMVRALSSLVEHFWGRMVVMVLLELLGLGWRDHRELICLAGETQRKTVRAKIGIRIGLGIISIRTKKWPKFDIFILFYIDL